MAFKMNKSLFSFGEGTGSSPKKFLGGAMGMLGGILGGGSLGQSQKMMDIQKKGLDKQYQAMAEKIGEEKAGNYMKSVHGYEPTSTPTTGGSMVKNISNVVQGATNAAQSDVADGTGGSRTFGKVGGGNLKERIKSILQELESNQQNS